MTSSDIKLAGKAISTFSNWPTYFLDYLHLTNKSHIQIHLNNGLRYKLRAKSSDRGILNEIWLHQYYTPEGFEIQKNDTVLDIGAHIGCFTIFAAHLAAEGKVFAFEPFNENYQLLYENVALNRKKNVILFDQAISENSGQNELYISEDGTAGHSLYFGANRKKITIPTVSLSDVINHHNIKSIDFLKMDCEGAEYEIFFTCPDRIWQMIQKISMEYHEIDEKRNLKTLVSLLEFKGYNVNARTDKCHMLYARRQ